MPAYRSIRIIALAGLALLAATASAQRIYCYKDADGRRVCGDSIPPEAASLDREVRNDQGVLVGREEGAITPEERQQMDEDKRAEEERRRAAEERRRYGQLLLDSYTSVQDIEQRRDRVLEQIEGQITLDQVQLENFKQKLEGLKQQATRYSPYSQRADAAPLPKNLELDLERTESSISHFEQELEDSHRELIETRESFERDIDYFRELTGDQA